MPRCMYVYACGAYFRRVRMYIIKCKFYFILVYFFFGSDSMEFTIKFVLRGGGELDIIFRGKRSRTDITSCPHHFIPLKQLI